MLPGLLDKLFLGDIRVEQLSSLAHAADCLAIAAGALSEAARAVAESCTSEPVSNPKKDNSEGTPTAKSTKSEDSELLIASPLNLILLNPAPDPITLPTDSGINQINENAGETELVEKNLPDDQIAGTDNNEPAIEVDKDVVVNTGVALVEPDLQEPLDILEANPHEELPVGAGGADPRPGNSSTMAETEQLVGSGQSYRILVENEFEVLLSVCALIGKDQRVICYMPCGPSPLAFYKQLVGANNTQNKVLLNPLVRKIESVTGIPVLFPERMGSAKRDAAYKKFLESDNSVVVMPSTTSTNIVMEGGNTWVIHVGWPPKREKYVSQIKIHQAKNNVIVACTGDLDLYPSRAPLMAQTKIWPKCGDSFTSSVNALRQSFEQNLVDIPDEVKEKVYANWIQTHGIYGPRYVKFWSSTVLVQRANHYLLHTLQYRHKSLDSGSAEEGLLPEVSLGFVSKNLLESAVQAGVLHVKHDSGPSNISSLAPADFKPATETMTELNPLTNDISVPGPSGEKTKTRKPRPRQVVTLPSIRG